MVHIFKEPCVFLAYLEPWYIQNLRNIDNPLKHLRCSVFFNEPWHIYDEIKILIRAYSFIINKVKRSLYTLLEKDDKISNKYCIFGLTVFIGNFVIFFQQNV